MNQGQSYGRENSTAGKMLCLFFLLLPFLSMAQNATETERLKDVVINHSPFTGSTPELNELFNSLFAANQIGIGEEMDSLFKIMNAPSTKLMTASDSGVYYFNSAFYWIRKSKYEKAQKNYTKAGIIFERHNLHLPALYVKAHMANIQYYMKELHYAFEQYQEVLNDPHCDTMLNATMHHNIGTLLMEIESDDLYGEDLVKKQIATKKITAHLDQAIEAFKAINYTKGYAGTYSVYVNIKINQQDYEGAQSMIDSCQVIALRSNDQARMAFLRIKKAMLFNQMGMYDTAIDTAQLAVNFFHGNGNFDQEEHALSTIYNAYTFKKDYQKAIEILVQMRAVTKKRSEKQLSDAIGKYQVQLETEKKNLIIQEKESQLESEKLKTSNRNRLLTALVLLIIAMILGFIIIFQRRQRKTERDKNALLLKSKSDNLKAVIYAEEKERKRIAADLHDGIVQQLGGLKLNLQLLLQNDTRTESKKVIDILDEATTELRTLSHQMMPRALSELGLVAALEDLFDKSIGLTTIQYQFEHFGILNRLPENIETAIFRISQELINNLIKHSEAKNVNIQLFKAQNNIIFIVEDNGKGFKKDSNSKGIGLMNISSRLDAINGQVNYEPSPGSGTLVTIKIPLI